MKNLRFFHASAPTMYRPWHPLFAKIDWDRISSGQIAVVDPADSTGILYLSEKDYKIQVRVSLSQDLPLVVLARPGDPKPDKSATNTSNKTPPTPPQKRGPTPNITEALSASDDIVVEDDSEEVSEKPLPSEEVGAPKSGKKIPDMSSEELDEYVKEISRMPDPSGKLYARALRKADAQKMRVSGGWNQFFSWFLTQLGDLAQQGTDTKGPMVTMSEKSLNSLIYRWGLILDYRLGGPLIPARSLRVALSKLAKDLVRIYTTQGSQTLIMKMKNTMLFMNHYLSGNTPTNPWLLGIPVGLARSGLPRIIPLVIRRQIAMGCVDSIRLMESILSSYKVMEGTYEPQTLENVVGPHPTIPDANLKEFDEFCRTVFWPKVVTKSLQAAGKSHLLRGPALRLEDGESPYIPLRSGPNESVGLLGAPLDAYAWSLAPRNYILDWCQNVGDERTIRLFDHTLQQITKRMELYPHTEELHLGKVVLLYEPAGKVRSIAVVDYWTQRVMHPVHKWMMDVLSTLSGDATFNQDKSVKSFAEMGHQTVWSVDLKSATDLIPLELYEVLLRGVWPEERVAIWSLLLADRWFATPQEGTVDGLPKVVKYGRGQPMGTLSSWASMALLHHAIVLFARHRSGKSAVDFSEYRVLGDDVVIGCPQTAAEYLKVTEGLCIPISLPKTLVGKLFIFASQIYLSGTSVSPSSCKEELGIRSFSQRLENALRAVSRGWITDKPTVSRFLRLLLPRRLYKASVKSWRVGKLGKAAQAALISAFGVGSRALAQLELRGSKIMTFLLALQDKSMSLVGDQSRLDQGTLDYIKDVESLLATVIVQRARNLAKNRLDSLIESGVRWSEWVDNMQVDGVLPTGCKPGPIKPILTYPVDNLATKLLDLALWPVLRDSYELFFGVQGTDAFSSQYTEMINDDEGWDEEDLGMGMTYSEDANILVSPGGMQTAVPRLWSKAGTVMQEFDEIISKLNVREIPEDVSPMDLADQAIGLLSDIPRVPDFLGKECLVPNRSPKEIDLLRSWVRQVKDWETTLRYLPLTQLASVAIPRAGTSLHTEAILDLHPLRLPLRAGPETNEASVPGQLA